MNRKGLLSERITATTTVNGLFGLYNDVISLNDDEVTKAYHQKMADILVDAIDHIKSVKNIVWLIQPVILLCNIQMINTFCNKIKTIVANTTDQHDLKLLKTGFIDNLPKGNNIHQYFHEIAKLILIQIINTATIYAHIQEITPSVVLLNDPKVSKLYVQKITSLTLAGK